MTVIAYRYGTLVADTLGNDEGTIIGYVRKVGKTRDGWLWGACGYASYMRPFAEWAETRIDNPPAFGEHHSDHILISPDGDVKWWTGQGWVEPMPQDFHAWGCGRELAMGAMGHGADAYRAVEIACRHDTACGGEPYGVSLTVDHELTPIIDPPVRPDLVDEGMETGTEGVADTFGWAGDPISPRDVAEGRARTWRQKMGLE